MIAIMESKAKYYFAKIVGLTILIISAVIFLVPFIWVTTISLKYPVDAFSMPPKWIFKPTLENHTYIWIKERFFHYLRNSLVVSIGTPLVSVPIGSLAGYAFSRHKTKNSKRTLFSILAIRMFPPMMLIIPFFIIAKVFRMHDNILFLLITYVSFNQPFTIWLMHGFIEEVPKEIDASAAIDGCSPFKTFIYVIIPLIRPALISASIFSFSLAWSEFFYALILTSNRAKTLTVATVEYQAELVQYWSYSAAAVVGIIIPAILILVFVQRYFIKGLVLGAVKG